MTIPSAAALARDIQQIDKRHHEHPDQIHKVPVQHRDLQMVGVVTSARVAQANHDERDYTADHVQQVQTSNAEKQSAKQWNAPWILEQADAFADQPHPFPNVEQREERASARG